VCVLGGGGCARGCVCCVFVHEGMYVCVWVCVCGAGGCVCGWVCMWVGVRVCVCVCVYAGVCAGVGVCVCVCVYVFNIHHYVHQNYSITV
jgi:hypothetical protein